MHRGARHSNRSHNLGCEHYKRKVKFLAPCCFHVYTCRFCHDKNEDHPLNRKEIKLLICMICGHRQNVRRQCQNCDAIFGESYSCLVCKLFDNEDKGQFHCHECGICRVGGANNYFHCDKCNCCLSLLLRNNHKCVENASRSECPVCLEVLHYSREESYIPPCSHWLHKACYDELIESGRKTCPICEVLMK